VNNAPTLRTAAVALVVGAALGVAGTFTPSVTLRGLAWGVDGTALVLASAVLCVHHLRRGHDAVAAGFLVFAVGQGLILSVPAAESAASVPTFAAGTALWAAGLALLSAPSVFPAPVRALGALGALLMAAVAVRIFAGTPLTPLASPLPFLAYPPFAAALVGLAVVHWREAGVGEHASRGAAEPTRGRSAGG
jgi:hypothetical protein